MGNGIEVEGVTRSRSGLAVLDSISFSLAAGSLTAVVGPSGCGKSTLLEIIAGLGEQDEGTVSVGSSEGAGERLERCAWMPQRDCLLPWMSALDNACLPLVNRGMGRSRAREAATDTFERVGLEGFD